MDLRKTFATVAAAAFVPFPGAVIEQQSKPLQSLGASVAMVFIPRTSSAAPSMGLDAGKLDPWEKCLESLRALRSLEDDWDDEGARRPHQGNINTAIAWVNAMRERLSPSFAPHVMPGTGGEVSLVWRTPQGYVEAEITAPGCFEWMRMLKGHRAEFCSNHGNLPTEGDWEG